MIMERDALELLLETARAEAQVIAGVATEPPHVYYLFNPKTGVLDRHVAEALPRKHAALDLASLCAFVSRVKGEGPNQASPIVWVGQTSVVAVLDDSTDRRNTLTWALPYSDRWKLFNEVLGKPFEQYDFHRMLRVKMRGMVPAGILPIVASLKLEQGRTQTGEVGTYKDTSSLATRREVSGVDQLPESFKVTVPILQGDLSVEIECTIEVSLDTGKLTIVAFPDEVVSAVRDRLLDLAQKIEADSGCAAFLGNP